MAVLDDVPYQRLVLPDGRALEYAVYGPPAGEALVFHHGTPSAALPAPGQVEAAADAGLRTILYSRPGYGGSDPHPGRRVADAAADVAALLDELDVPRFVAAGWSGGGPHALACGALLTERCAGVACIAGVAPHDAAGLDWLAGMGEDNLTEFGAAEAGRDELEALLGPAAEGMADITAPAIVEAIGSLLPAPDRELLDGPAGEHMAASFRRAVAPGIAGWRDDDLALVTAWGFAASDVSVPVTVWQGDEDLMVPAAHGAWLAEHLPAAELHRLPEEGHLLVYRCADAILADLGRRF